MPVRARSLMALTVFAVAGHATVNAGPRRHAGSRRVKRFSHQSARHALRADADALDQVHELNQFFRDAADAKIPMMG